MDSPNTTQGERTEEKRAKYLYLFSVLAFATMAVICFAMGFHGGGWGWLGSIVVGVLLGSPFVIIGHMWLQALFRIIGMVRYTLYLRRTKPGREATFTTFLTLFFLLVGVFVFGGAVLAVTGFVVKVLGVYKAGTIAIAAGLLAVAMGGALLAAGFLFFVLFALCYRILGSPKRKPAP